jgi:hypothetical protein
LANFYILSRVKTNSVLKRPHFNPSLLYISYLIIERKLFRESQVNFGLNYLNVEGLIFL